MRLIKSANAVMCILLITLGFTKGLAQNIRLVKTKINDRITVPVPRDWIPMDGMDFTERYPSVRAPLAAFTNPERTVDLSINISATQWPDANLEMISRFFKASIFNMFDRVDMIDEGIQEVGKHKLIFFEFESRVEGNRRDDGTRNPVLKYTYIQYWVREDQTLVFAFNSPLRSKDEWQETARKIMTSLKLD